METEFLKELNENLKQGIPTSKSKKADLVPKIAVAIHLLEWSFSCLTTKEDTYIKESITIETLQKAICYVEYLEEQKELFNTVFINFLLCLSLTEYVFSNNSIVFRPIHNKTFF